MTRKILGVVHLLPLPGSPDFEDIDLVLERARSDTSKYYEAGFDGIIIENFGDMPFEKEARKETIASMAIVANEIRKTFDFTIGINLLRNDPIGAIAIAGVAKCDFVRINVHVGTYVTDQGIIEGNAGKTLRYRRMFPSIKIYADVHVKHAYPLMNLAIEEAALDCWKRGKADALIVTGKRTGGKIDIEELKRVKQTVGCPVFAGSGVGKNNISEILKYADGAIIGSQVKRNNDPNQPVDEVKAKEIIKLVKSSI
ncbi:MAG: BtpA/SgcQ family protein [Candidatus Hydrothermarchaeota archaeon]